MVKIDASKFVIERNPKATEPDVKRSSWSGSSTGSSFGSSSPLRTMRMLKQLRQRELEDLVFKYPRQVAQYLADIKVSAEELDDAIYLINRPRERSFLDLFDDEGLLSA